jgi:hypothetical protein
MSAHRLGAANPHRRLMAVINSRYRNVPSRHRLLRGVQYDLATADDAEPRGR